MNISPVSSLGGYRSSALRTGDARSPTFISISSPPAASQSPSKRSPPSPRRNESVSRSPIKRSQTSFSTVQPSHSLPKNKLIELCKMRQWDQVYERCQSHPHEAFPVPIRPTCSQSIEEEDVPPVKRERKTSDAVGSSPTSCGTSASLQPIQHSTPLGIACLSEYQSSDQMQQVVEKLLNACPEQIQCNEGIVGHTPLRSAVRNMQCTPQLLQRLVLADMNLPGNTFDKAILRPDQDGFSPIDHLIMGVHSGRPFHSLDSIRVITEMCPAIIHPFESDSSSRFAVSPLIRLFSLGSSFSLHPRDSQERRNTRRTKPRNTKDPLRMERILECAKCLLPANVAQLQSRATQCTALHVALRNYGNALPVIQLLLEADDKHEMVQKRNHFGDLPLHVACSVGVPTNVLSLVLQHTVAAMPKVGDYPHPLVWTVNKSGYTPVDLEWMRHIEGGRGFFEMRSFYPLETRGIPNESAKQNEFYQELLQEAVDQLMEGHSENRSRAQEARIAVGALLDRIIYVVKVAHKGSYNVSKKDMLLHAASSLSRVPGPMLPSPLLRLFEWMNPDQVRSRDEMGRLPLHYALMAPSVSCAGAAVEYDKHQSPGSTADTASWARLLLERSPSSASVPDKTSRLPLHYALERRRVSDNNLDDNDNLLVEEWKHAIIEPLVEAFPNSVDRKDPKSGLYPFMQAALVDTDGSSLETTFFLLRRNPVLVESGIP